MRGYKMGKPFKINQKKTAADIGRKNYRKAAFRSGE